MAYGLITYQDAARREDLMDLIGDVSPDETPLMTLLPDKSASQTQHEWLTFNLARPTSVQNDVEGGDATYGDLTQPSRLLNITSTIRQSVRVSGTEEDVSVAGMQSPFAFQKAQALRTWKSKAEYKLLHGSRVSGSSGVARGMRGIMEWITTNATARNSGTSLSETEIDNMVDNVWTAVNPDYVFNLMLMPYKLKSKIAGFSGNSTRTIPATDKRLVRDILVYTSAGGDHRIMAHKDVPNSAGSVAVIGMNDKLFAKAWLRKPKFKEYDPQGDQRKGEWIGEFTLESHEERASCFWHGYNQNG